jgi:hypothetical protein
MLTHIVCWKYKPEITEDVRAHHVEALRSLPSIVPGLVDLKVGTDVLHLDRSFHTGLVASFPDRAALEAYTVHPDHQRVASIGKEIAEQVVSVDFESAS